MKSDKTTQLIFGKSNKANRFTAIKIFIFFVVLFSVTLLQTNAQVSGLRIATSGDITILSDGEVRISGITSKIASLRKTVVSNDANFNQLTPAQLQRPVGSTKQAAPKEIISKETVTAETTVKDTSETVPATPVKQAKQINIPAVPASTTITSATIYDIPGTTSIPSNQYTSLQASFQFVFYNRNTGVQNPAGLVELYKLEKNTSTLSFCIPSGGCASVNIPIQITENGRQVIAGAGSYASGGGAGAGMGKSPLYMVGFPNGGYLQPGEYAFIDKSSLRPDGSALVCFTFTVRQ